MEFELGLITLLSTPEVPICVAGAVVPAVVLARRSGVNEVCQIAKSALIALVWSSAVLCLPTFLLVPAKAGASEFALRCDLIGSFDQTEWRPTTREARIVPLERRIICAMPSLDAQQSFAARVGEILQEVIEFARKLSDAAEADPVARSQADDELNFNQEMGPKGPWGRAPVEHAYTTAALLYGAAGQYLRSLRQLLNDEVALFGFQVVTRALQEAAARSWWILDPACSVRERVERAYDEQYYSFNELRKLAATIGGDVAKQFSSDIRLRADVAELGLHERTEKSAPLGRPIGVGSPRLKATEVVVTLTSHLEIADGERWYRTFSGIAHSALYAQIGYWEPVRGPGIAREHLEPALPMTAIAHAAVLSIAAYLGAIERHALLYGRDWKQLQSMRQSATTRITALHDMHIFR